MVGLEVSNITSAIWIIASFKEWKLQTISLLALVNVAFGKNQRRWIIELAPNYIDLFMISVWLTRLLEVQSALVM